MIITRQLHVNYQTYQKYTSFLDQLINYDSLIIPINSNKTMTFASWISRFFGEKMKNYYFSENAGFLGYKMSIRFLDR